MTKGRQTKRIAFDAWTIGKGTSMPLHRAVLAAAAALGAMAVLAPSQPVGAQVTTTFHQPGQSPLHIMVSDGGTDAKHGAVASDASPEVVVVPKPSRGRTYRPSHASAMPVPGHAGSRTTDPMVVAAPSLAPPAPPVWGSPREPDFVRPQTPYDAVYGGGYASVRPDFVPPRPVVPEPSENFMRLATTTYQFNTGVPLQVAANVVERMHVEARDCALRIGPYNDCRISRGGIAFSYGRAPSFTAAISRHTPDGIRPVSYGEVPVVFETPRGMQRGPGFARMTDFENAVDRGVVPDPIAY